MDVGSIINWSITAWGAGLATFVAVQQRRDHKPRLRTTLALVAGQPIVGVGAPNAPTRMNYFATSSNNPNAQFLALNAENVGERGVTLKAIGLQPPIEDFLIMPPSPSGSPLPRWLEPGESCIDAWPAADVARSLRAAGCSGAIMLSGFYIDGVRKHHRAKPLTFDIDIWVRR